MPLKGDKQIRVDKIRKTPLEPTGSSGVFRAVLFFNVAARRRPLRTEGPTIQKIWRGLRDITAQAH